MDTNTRQIALSVIVPCFNVEPYLDRSLGCLERQWNERDDYEIILINDASTDGTIDKLNEFKQRYPNNVVVIDKKVNAGAAEARNSGLDVARGEWIVFFDPDDALVDNGYGTLLERASESGCDILSFAISSLPDYNWCDDVCHQAIDSEIIWQGTSDDYLLHNPFGVSCSYLFNKKVLEGHRFPRMVICEDTVFNLPLFLKKWLVCKTNACVYLYCVRNESATTTINPQRLNQSCNDIMKAILFLNSSEKGLEKEIITRLREHQSTFAVNLVTRLLLSTKNRKELKLIQKQLCELSLIPLASGGLKAKLFDFFIRHPRMMLMFRPFYRMLRFLRKSLIHG